MSERQTSALQHRAQIIRDHPIQNKLDNFRASFAATCDRQGHPRSAPGLLARPDLQHLTLELLVALSSLPVARILPSKDGQGTIANDLLDLIASVSTGSSIAESTVSLLSTALDDCSTDEGIWDRVYAIYLPAPQSSRLNKTQSTSPGAAAHPQSRTAGRRQEVESSTRRTRHLRPSYVLGHGPPRVSRRGEKRYKVDIACDPCRRRKVKCDGIRPACGPCLKSKRIRAKCQYSSGNEETSFTEGDDTQVNDSIQLDAMSEDELSDPGHQDFSHSALPDIGKAPAIASTSHCEATSIRANVGIVETYQEHFHEYGVSSMQAFFERLRASIDAQLGIPAGGNPIMIPLTDAPMFLAPSSNLGPIDHDKNDLVLPSRKHADILVDLYWSRVYPIEPILDRGQFESLYDALYSGTLSDGAEHLFACAFNAVLAMATQSQEHVDLDQRQQASKTYFDRAWRILRPGQELWEIPSIELVECLLLMCTYLRCTSNFHQAWMAVGAAVRVAQSFGLHLPGNSPGDASHVRRMHLWRVCIYLDNQISMAQGRPRTIHSCFINAILEHKVTSQEAEPISTFITKSIELFQSTISIKSMAYHGRLASSLEQLAQKDDEYLHMVLKLEDRLLDWEQDLPPYLKYNHDSTSHNNRNSALAATFKLRIAHGRIFLFRPMLAFLCLSKAHHHPHGPSNQTMRQQIIHNCASVCMRNAQEIISILQEQSKPEVLNNTPIPWWHRMLYLHVAATTLVAATMSSDIATEFQTSASWDQLISLLHAHIHCSGYISQYSQAFQTLLSEVSSIRSEHFGVVPPTSESLPYTPYLQEVFPGPNSFPFGLEDMIYLDNM